MFCHAFKHLLSTLLMFSVASCAVLPRELTLAPRQGSCLGALRAPNPVNNVGRISFQSTIDDREQSTWHPNNLIDVHITVRDDVTSTQNIEISISNRSSSGNAIILTNFQDTLPTTEPREQIRVTVPGQTRANGVVRVGTTTECVHLPRLDGTWYFQVEQ